jgi:hypothetical protein
MGSRPPEAAKEGELSESQAEIVKIVFVAIGIATIVTIVLILEIFIPIEFVVFGLIGIGFAGVVYYDLIRSPNVQAQKRPSQTP